MRKKRALISVNNKSNLLTIAKFLQSHAIEIVATGNTYQQLRLKNISSIEINNYTHFPEILDGRVKTLHPCIHGGILAKTIDAPDLNKHNILPIDFVIVNLYPFEQTWQDKPTASDTELVESIDIGGVALLRGAAKNFSRVTVLCDPNDYERFMTNLDTEQNIPLNLRRQFASKVFAYTAKYDQIIASYFHSNPMTNKHSSPNIDDSITINQTTKVCDLRYGENPHQAAALYHSSGKQSSPLFQALPHTNRKLSYNNILDIATAIRCQQDMMRQDSASDLACITIIKHQTPCGVAVMHINDYPNNESLLTDLWAKALANDPISAYGGIVSCSRPVSAQLAQNMVTTFLEILIAPSFSDEAVHILRKKWKNIQLIEFPNQHFQYRTIHEITDFYLLQQADEIHETDNFPEWQCVSQNQANTWQSIALTCAWRLAKNVHSNAITLWSPRCNTANRYGQCIGLGGGQTNRINAAKIAVAQAKEFSHSLLKAGCVAASDGFLPFADSVSYLGDQGITAIVQPGGSKRDQQSIDEANRRSIAMYFTKRRHFLH